jgi:type IV secretory pathway VirB10-like protein
METRATEQHREIQHWLSPVKVVFNRARSAGVALPDELVQADEHFAAIQAALPKLPDEPIVAARRLADGVAGGGPVPGDLGKRQLKAEAAYEEARAQIQVLRLAEEAAAGQLRRVFDGCAEEIIVDGMRPALEAILGRLARKPPNSKARRTGPRCWRSTNQRP